MWGESLTLRHLCLLNGCATLAQKMRVFLFVFLSSPPENLLLLFGPKTFPSCLIPELWVSLHPVPGSSIFTSSFVRKCRRKRERAARGNIDIIIIISSLLFSSTAFLFLTFFPFFSHNTKWRKSKIVVMLLADCVSECLHLLRQKSTAQVAGCCVKRTQTTTHTTSWQAATAVVRETHCQAKKWKISLFC